MLPDITPIRRPDDYLLLQQKSLLSDLATGNADLILETVPVPPEIAEARFRRLRDEYVVLALRHKLRIDDLFLTEEFDYPALAAEGFSQHPEFMLIRETVANWASANGIDIPTLEGYNSMTDYLHGLAAIPTARMIHIGKIYALLFWINDKFGREIQKDLSDADREYAAAMLKDLAQTIFSLGLMAHGKTESHIPKTKEAQLLQEVLLEVYAELKSEGTEAEIHAQMTWFKQFLVHGMRHLVTAVKDQDIAARNDVLEIWAYYELRNQVGGMPITVAMFEYLLSQYINWDQLKSHRNLYYDLLELVKLVSYIGVAVNDIFSTPKEVFLARSSFNAVALNGVANDLGLEAAIQLTAQQCIEMCQQFFTLKHRIEETLSKGTYGPNLMLVLTNFLQSCLVSVQATWMWQRYGTERYKMPIHASIFEEMGVESTTEA